MADLGFWNLTPRDVLGKDEGAIIEEAKKRYMFFRAQQTTQLIGEMKNNSLNQRTYFAKNLVNCYFTLRELYNRHVNGRVIHGGQRKDRLDIEKMDLIKTEVFRYFPCVGSETGKLWSECVRAIDKGNIYLFSVINKKFDIEPVLEYVYMDLVVLSIVMK